MLNVPALPFTLHRSNCVIAGKEITSTIETIHRLLRVDGRSLVLQWRVKRQTDRVGAEIRSDRELEPVREATIPIASLSGAVVRSRRWRSGRAGPGPDRADLRAFEGLTEVRKDDKDAARELATQVELAIGDHALQMAPALPGERPERKLPGPGDG